MAAARHRGILFQSISSPYFTAAEGEGQEGRAAAARSCSCCCQSNRASQGGSHREDQNCKEPHKGKGQEQQQEEEEEEEEGGRRRQEEEEALSRSQAKWDSIQGSPPAGSLSVCTKNLIFL